ncbi:hypothetical protein HSB1_06340 [Halogranum salarium B-1]|uniref:Uncharacterized protein n=1 Tax=Halogranum salarium B-1 TaxID=1210908 RepID=J3A7J8_9EURY|nr:hypothetical protein HSB1_06340 [Halogranum salarium B-1]
MDADCIERVKRDTFTRDIELPATTDCGSVHRTSRFWF